MKKICIIGDSKTGKTTLAISLAHELIRKRPGMSCIIVLCKNLPSEYPIIFPYVSSESIKPLSSIISLQLNPSNLGKYIITKKNDPDIGYLGYTESDLKNKYPDLPVNTCSSLISNLEIMTDYIIFDCDDDIFHSPLSLEGIKSSDAHIKIMKPDIKSIIYENMTGEYIKEKTKGKESICILNNTYESKYCTKEGFRYKYELPFRENILSEFHKGNITGYDMSKDPKTKRVIEDLVKEISDV